MTGRIILGAFMALPGAVAAFLGILFSAASAGKSSRLITGLLLIATGAVLFIFGLRFLRKGLKGSPAGLLRTILRCAAKYNGLVSGDVLFAETGEKERTEIELAKLAGEGRVKKESASGKVLYRFPEFQFELKMKVCPYCGKDVPVKTAIETCPACGGDLKIRALKTSEGGDLFSMDD